MNNEATAINRRKFIINSIKAAGGFALLAPSSSLAGSNILSFNNQFTVQQVIDIIMKEGALSPVADTVDTIKTGDASQTVSGIVTTMFPTIPVIEEAARRNANFIIAHEPSFYNHKDDKQWVKNNSVLQQKLQLLEKHNMVTWRFHDYCHALKPDAISYGFAKKTGWLPYFKTGQTTITIPKLSLQQLVNHLKTSLNIAHLRIIGNLHQICERVTVLPGAWGGLRQVSAVESEKPDVLIVGESSEWETIEYMRDTASLGGKTALIVLGHSVSEEPGMEWVADWLKPKLPGVNITHIASGDPFTWI
jgi:putative NIF3 family GTP cyclohydrolase 1 type 2